MIHCWTYFFGILHDLQLQPITPGSWHKVRIEISNLEPITFDFYDNEKHLGQITPERSGQISKRLEEIQFHLISYAGDEITGYVDDVYFGPAR